MTDLVLGIICVLYGVFTVIASIIKPGMFSKLERMKEAYGEKAGYAIHLVSYSLIPLGTWTVWISPSSPAALWDCWGPTAPARPPY